MNWLEYRFYGNTVFEWVVAVGIAFGAAILFYYAYRIVLYRLRGYAARTTTAIDDFAVEVMEGTRPLFLVVVALYLGSQYLELPPKPVRIVDRVAVVALLIQIALWGSRAVVWWLTPAMQNRNSHDNARVATVSVLGFIARLVLWSVIILVILDNVGINITALVASLGIGGIAVALAVQSILGDIFASLSIALDKPFVEGDFIIVENEMGTVEHVGLKTTRIRSLSGEQIIFANNDLLKSRIRNYKRMAERRVVFGFGVVYETSAATLKRLPAMVRAIVEAQPKVRFDRAHFKGYGDSSLDFEVVYFVQDPDYNLYMDIQQAINLELFTRLGEERVSFAYPTRTLYVHGADIREPARGTGTI